MGLIARALAEHLPPAPTVSIRPPPDPPPERGPIRRGLRPAPPDTRQYGALSIEQGQQMIADAVSAYLSTPSPAHALLIAAPAGLGKTTLAVSTAERRAGEGGRVLYLGPRRDFFADLVPIMAHPAWWYAWEPRSDGRGQGIGATCRYAPQIAAWMQRGYSAMDFCANARICGWSYIHNDCPWHAQARTAPSIVFGQYEHLSLGHPLIGSTDLLIGDELPLRAFLHAWHIPAADIIPDGMQDGPRLEIMRALRRACAEAQKGGTRGPDLLVALGGAEFVAETCADVPLAEIQPPDLRHADAAEQVPYGHLLATLSMLRREADAACAGRPCIARVQARPDGLRLLRRRMPETTPEHVIWLDATASAPMYRALLGRPVEVINPDVRMAGRVFQVWPSLNTKRHLTTGVDASTPDTEGGGKVAHVAAQVRHIIASRGYERPAFVTYKGLVSAFGTAENAAHFHGSRGTNRLQDCDALIVIGTPQPSIDDLIETATMVYDRREVPFDPAWTVQDRPFAGQPWAYPSAGFWHDIDLQTLLEQHREAELVQALHRARPLRRQVDVWLLTNLPLPDIPVELVSLHELFGAPPGIDPYRWPEVVRVAEERMREASIVTSADLVQAGICQPAAARRFLETLAESQGWTLTKAPPNGRGKPPMACVKSSTP